jgi:hypothetical protein
MLRVTVQNGETATTILVEGKLTGPWVDVLEESWLSVLSSSPESILVDLKAVSSTSAAGKELLARMYGQGAEFLTAEWGATRAVVEGIERGNKARSIPKR